MSLFVVNCMTRECEPASTHQPGRIAEEPIIGSNVMEDEVHRKSLSSRVHQD
jgi:hypothetical protein